MREIVAEKEPANLSRALVLAQLSRVIDSTPFRTSARRASLLRLVVEKTLDGVSLSEKDIADLVFGGYVYGAGVVRTTMNHVRRGLAVYYGVDGRNDSIVISLPPGHGYRCHFKTTLVSSIVRRVLQEGLELMRKQDPHSLQKARSKFEEASKLNPQLPDPYVGIVETLILEAIHSDLVSGDQQVESILGMATLAVECTPPLWQAFAVRGFALFATGKWKLAKADFDKALKLDKHATQEYPGYQAYLLATGNHEQALRLVRRRAAKEPTDVLAQVMYGLCLYLLRDFSGAWDVLDKAITMDRTCWLAHMSMSFVYLGLRNFKEAAFSASDMEELAGSGVWSGYIALALSGLPIFGECSTRDFYQYYSNLILHPEPGKNSIPTLQHVQMLLGGRADISVKMLKAAYGSEFLMPWFHLWPAFDKLREIPSGSRILKANRPP